MVAIPVDKINYNKVSKNAIVLIFKEFYPKKAKNVSYYLKRCFNRESITYLCTSDKAGFFTNKKYVSYKCWTCTEWSEALTFLMENIFVQFDGMVYQQIVGIPMGTNCVPLIAD